MREVLFHAGCGIVLGSVAGIALVLCVPGQGGVLATPAACVATGALGGAAISMVRAIVDTTARQGGRRNDGNNACDQ
jgi:hypothetical protein